MRDTDELRQALAAETADLAVHLPPDLIRRRARRIRARRVSGVAAVAVLATVAVALPTLLLGGRSSPGPGYQVAGGTAAPSASAPAVCPTPSTDDGEAFLRRNSLGPAVETGATLDAPKVNRRYDVILALVGTRDQPGFAIAFRDQQTGKVEPWHVEGLSRGPNGDLSGRRPSDPGHQFLSAQIGLGPHSVLDVGLYTRAAHRITVASEGHATEARTAGSAETGWTFFWVQRDATPLPLYRNSYKGPEQLTITAHDAEGGVQHTVTGGVNIGHHVETPRNPHPDVKPTPPATTAPTCAPVSTTK